MNIQSKEELIQFLSSEVVDISEATEILGSSRQNLHKHLEKGNLVALKSTSRYALYLRKDVLALKENMRVRN